MEPVSTEVDGYVPRVEEGQILAQVERVRADGRSRAVLLYGKGGVGKTRMVRALAARDGVDPATRWIRPIDVDDSNYWLLENLQKDVAEQLDPDGRFFEPFYSYLSQLPRFSARRIGRDTVSSHHNRMREAFIECYERFLGSTGATVVITLDTVETIRSMYLLISLAQWMKALPGTLFVLSGRPMQGWGGRDTIREHLEDPRDPIEVAEVPLRGFQEADARAFLDASVLGGSLSDGQKDRLAELTDREPLWLALAVDYLRLSGPPPEMAPDDEPVGERVREAFRRRLVTPYRSTEFWPETIKRLAVVRHSMDEQAWRLLMADRTLPAGVADWDRAWDELRARPWIRRRANDRFVTLHDALAEELGLRLIPLHDQDEQWRLRQWRRAAEIYEELVGDEYDDVLAQLADVFETFTEPDEKSVVRRVATLDTRKRELDQMRTASLHYLLLSDREAGTDRFVALFGDAAKRHDMHFQELLCHELERFLPPAQEQEPQQDAIGVVIDRFREWLDGQPMRYLEIGLNVARFLIQNSQPRPALILMDRLPERAADVELRYRFANERGNALMRIPGEVSSAGQFFEQARRHAEDFEPPIRERRLAEAFKELGFYSRNLGQWRDADEQYERAAEVIATIVGPGREDSDREELASIRTNWAYLKALQGDYEDARNLVESAMAVRSRLGSDHGIAVSMSVSGEVYRYDRKYAHAWELYQQAEALFVTLRNWPWLGLILQEQAVCLFQAHEEGLDLVDEPMEQAKQIITRALSICRDQAIRWYPSALNRAGRIFGKADPDQGLKHFDSSITEARRVADGWFLSAGLIEYLELSYRVWTETGDIGYRDRITARVEDVLDAIREYRFSDLRGRWELLQGHLAVHDAVASGSTEGLDDALRHYSTGFLVLADRRVGSHGSAAIAGEFERFQLLFAQLPTEVQAEWYTALRNEWSAPASGDRSTSLLARLEQLY
ncbi:MAG TPA: tetratricopeptide repeat protein [Pseudonocardiaceae bacterium]|nr:tetratricopeptide repeat protein [Pseudonocardiaceae bacterium]